MFYKIEEIAENNVAEAGKDADDGETMKAKTQLSSSCLMLNLSVLIFCG